MTERERFHSTLLTPDVPFPDLVSDDRLALNEKRAAYDYYELSLKDPATNQW